VQRVLRDGLPQGVCLNINFPKGKAYNGVKVCRMSPGSWTDEVTKCHHPRGYDYWWMVGHYQNDAQEATDTDRWALDHGFVAITPTRIDVTAYEAMEQLKSYEV
jgi:5'-nucleotidase